MNRHPDFLLNEVNEPQDIKGMSLDELKQLASEMRQASLGTGFRNWRSRRAQPRGDGTDHCLPLRL